MLCENMAKEVNKDVEEKKESFLLESIISGEPFRIRRIIICEAHEEKKGQSASL